MTSLRSLLAVINIQQPILQLKAITLNTLKILVELLELAEKKKWRKKKTIMPRTRPCTLPIKEQINPRPESAWTTIQTKIDQPTIQKTMFNISITTRTENLVIRMHISRRKDILVKEMWWTTTRKPKERRRMKLLKSIIIMHLRVSGVMMCQRERQMKPWSKWKRSPIWVREIIGTLAKKVERTGITISNLDKSHCNPWNYQLIFSTTLQWCLIPCLTWLSPTWWCLAASTTW